MALGTRIRPEPTIEVHTPHHMIPHQLPPLPTVYRVESIETIEEGERGEEDVAESRIGFAECVAGYRARGRNSGQQDYVSHLISIS